MDNSTNSNSTFPSNSGAGMQTKILLPTIMYCVAFILGTIGNGLVIYVTGFKMKKTVNTIWFLNLAVADFIFTSFLIFSIVNTSRNFDWPFGDFLCKLNTLVVAFNMFASIFLLTVISLDRCLSTWVIVWAKNKRTVCKAKIICLLIWLTAFGCSLPYGIDRQAAPSGNVTLCASVNPYMAKMKRMVIFRFLVGFLIPYLIILCSYIAIGVRIRSLHTKRSLKSIRIILAVIMTFLICWLPFHILQMLMVKYYAEQRRNQLLKNVLDIGLPISGSLAFFNSCLNPFLYVFMCEDFKKKIRQSILMILEEAFYEELPIFSMSRTSTCVKVEVTDLRDTEEQSQSQTSSM